ncbi:MAG: hypothetical protein K2X47_09325 [Bdellovibrionales bacterium]|nr:hypothetical protein [Bdellovibrionales bacterium]
MKMFVMIGFFISVSFNFANAFSAIVLSESGQARRVELPIAEVLDLSAGPFSGVEALDALKSLRTDLPEEISLGISAGIKGGVAGILRAGIRGGFTLRYERAQQ